MDQFQESKPIEFHDELSSLCLSCLPYSSLQTIFLIDHLFNTAVFNYRSFDFISANRLIVYVILLLIY
jgi:hypothetical protein